MKKLILKKEKFICIAALALFVGLLYLFKIPCPIKELLGVPCAGCGMTRAWLSVLRLDFKAAFEYHSLFWTVPVMLVLFWTDGKLFGRLLGKPDRICWIDLALMVGVVSIYVIRWIVVLCM